MPRRAFQLLLAAAIGLNVVSLAAARARTESSRGLGPWTYIQVSASHVQVFGLAFAQVDGDGYLDLLTGPYWYRNPGGDLTGAWTQNPLPTVDGDPPDALLALDVDGDANLDVVAMSGTAGRVYWLEREATSGSWNVVVQIGDVGVSNHGISSQGYRLADLEAGGRLEIVINVDPCYYFRIPAVPQSGNWPRVTAIAPELGADEEVAVGDVDRDGRLDLVGSNGDTGEVRWFRNPGDGSGDWTGYLIASLPDIAFNDRLEVAHLDQDGRLDVVVSEETGGGDGAETWVLRQPADPTSSDWPASPLVSQGSTNSLRVADFDRDGDVDIVTAEHYGELDVVIWENDGGASFTPRPVDTGHESHFGVKPADLDRDGLADLVSIAWNAPQLVHLWRNDGPDLGFLLFGDGFESGNASAWSLVAP